MPDYKYQARDAHSKLAVGVITAANKSTAASDLLKQKLTPIRIIEVKVAAKKQGSLLTRLNNIEIFPRPVKPDELILLCRQLYSLSKAGVPIMNILQRLAETAKNPTLQRTLVGMTEKISGGQTFANSLAQYPAVFPEIFINIIRAGEDSGQLEYAYQQLALHLEREQDMGRKIKSATRYPMIVITMVFIAMIVVSVVVVPKFATMFAAFKSELPLMTRILLATSNFLIDKGMYLGGVLICLWLVFKRVLKTKTGRYAWDKFKLKQPVVGSILYRSYLARFARGFALMQGSGVPLVKSVELAANMVGNSFVSRRLELMRESIHKGEGLTKAALVTGMFSPLALQMLQVGEEAGTVDDMLKQVADFYEKEVDYDLGKMSQALEPIIMVIMGLMVLVLALGVYQPMFSMSKVMLDGKQH